MRCRQIPSVVALVAVFCLALLVVGCSSDEEGTSSNNTQQRADADVSVEPDADPGEDTTSPDTGPGGPDADGGAEPDATQPDAAEDAGSSADTGGGGDEDLWVTAYLAAWKHYAPPGGNWGNLPTDEIDWDAFTHLNYFALSVNDDGTTGPIEEYQNINPDRTEAIVEAAHANDKPVLISVGGWGSHDGFVGSISDANRSNFVAHLVDLMNQWDFDGIDLDMEPIRSADVDDYKAFVEELHAALQAETTPLLDRPLLTTATAWQPQMHAELAGYFDQINLMTYDFSGPWDGWVVWHNSCLSNGGYVFESTGQEVPSVEREVDEFLAAGVPADKLGIGIDFYGYVWTGVTEPRQSWNTPPDVEDNVAYHDIMDDYYHDDYYRWDDDALAPYLSIEDQNPQLFVSYDDERAIGEKMDYVHREGLGGAIIWELGGGYREGEADGQRDVLLQAVKDGLYRD